MRLILPALLGLASWTLGKPHTKEEILNLSTPELRELLRGASIDCSSYKDRKELLHAALKYADTETVQDLPDTEDQGLWFENIEGVPAKPANIEEFIGGLKKLIQDDQENRPPGFDATKDQNRPEELKKFISQIQEAGGIPKAEDFQMKQEIKEQTGSNSNAHPQNAENNEISINIDMLNMNRKDKDKQKEISQSRQDLKKHLLNSDIVMQGTSAGSRERLSAEDNNDPGVDDSETKEKADFENTKDDHAISYEQIEMAAEQHGNLNASDPKLVAEAQDELMTGHGDKNQENAGITDAPSEKDPFAGKSEEEASHFEERVADSSEYWEIAKVLGTKYSNLAIVNAQHYGTIIWELSYHYGNITWINAQIYGKHLWSQSQVFGKRALDKVQKFTTYMYKRSLQLGHLILEQYKIYREKESNPGSTVEKIDKNV